MPSRKKARGKARKTAKAKAKRDNEEERQKREEVDVSQLQYVSMSSSDGSDEPQKVGSVRVLHGIEKCKHGFVYSSEEERICVEFVEEYQNAMIAAVKNNTKSTRGDGDVVHDYLRHAFLYKSRADAKDTFAKVLNDDIKDSNVREMSMVISHLINVGTENFIQGDYAEARNL